MTQTPSSRAWLQAGMACAVMAALFCAVVCAMLIVNELGGRRADPLQSTQLENLKGQLVAEPKSEAIKHRIRDLDLQLREDFFRRRALGDRGAWLLLAGLVVFLAAAKGMASARRRPYVPQAQLDEPRQRRRALAVSRWSVVALGMLIVGSAGLRAARTPATQEPPSAPRARQWPQFRGPEGTGVSPHADVPTHWDGPTGAGILWKARVALSGHNSPILWAGRVFCSGADARRRVVFCFDAGHGQLRWEHAVAAPPGAATDASADDSFSAGPAASTMATDGDRVYALFGDGRLECLDVNGVPIWSKRLGPLENDYGHAASLVTHGDALIVQLDQATQDAGLSALIAFDGSSGSELWRIPRPVAASWTTPIIADTPNGNQLITVAEPYVIAYDPAEGSELWRARCVGGEITSSAIQAGGLVLVCSSDELIALRTDGRGDVTDSHVAWIADQGVPDITSPLSDGRRVWLLTTSGTLSCYRINDGSLIYEQELDMPFNASPSLAAGRLYLVSTQGTTLIIEAGEAYRLLGRTELGETVTASAAFADGRIYLRGRRHLYCIGQATP